MKKFIFALTIFMSGLAAAGCSYDDSDLWEAVDDIGGRVDALEQAAGRLNSEIVALNAIVEAMSRNLFITSVDQTEQGCRITFSDGSTAFISNGRDGADAPVVSVAEGDDGNLYWTLNGEWLLANGERVRANGLDGRPGSDAVAPQVRINPQSGEWEISTDGGETWSTTGVGAGGSGSIFESVVTDDPDSVTFVVAGGGTFTLPRYDDTMPVFEIEGAAAGEQSFQHGESRTFAVTERNVVEYAIQKPDGWRAAYAGGVLTVTAPDKANAYAEQTGTVSVVAVSANNRSMIARLNVAVCEYTLRVLTFEDADVRFDAYEMTIGANTFNIATWSDLIDEQYGGPMIYGDEDDFYMNEEPYFWYDQNNTELMHVFPESYGYYCYWSGGHAISNYGDRDIESTGDHMHQLTVNGPDGAAGHNGSANFAVHFGYIDGSGFNMTANLPALAFGDGVERVIDHMYVMPNNYALNCYTNGNSLTSRLGPDDYVKIIATGFDSSESKTGTCEIVIANGDCIITEWTKWDLSGLGKVARVEFNILGSNDNGYGFSQPAYFAYDDVAVRF